MDTAVQVSPALDDVAEVNWLHRRAGFGLHPDEATDLSADGAAAALDRLLTTPDEQDDPWDGLALDAQDGGRIEAIAGWLTRLATTSSPFVDRRTWMLHGWIVSGMDKARPTHMVQQIRLLHDLGGGSFPDLLRAITVDQAMLTYLDGRTSTAEAPNENYGRELLELFALGVGEAADGSDQPYTEDDVLAAARALTGWTFRPRDAEAFFVAARHDDTPQTLLGVDGVNDVDSVIDAVVAHPEHARFVARRITAEYVGDPSDPILDGVVDELAAVYLDSGLRLDPVIGEALRLALDGAWSPIVLAPIPWLVASARALGVGIGPLARIARGSIRDMGQTPMFPPSVAGWPGGVDWLRTSSLIARTNLAARLVEVVDDDEPLLVAARDRDTDRMAALLGLRIPFGPSSIAAITGADSREAALTLALVSPEGLLS